MYVTGLSMTRIFYHAQILLLGRWAEIFASGAGLSKKNLPLRHNSHVQKVDQALNMVRFNALVLMVLNKFVPNSK